MDRQNKKSLATVLRHRVIIESNSGTTDGEGGFVDTWTTTIADVPASVDPIQAKQIFQYRSVNVDATHWIKMRGYISITESDRIRWGTRIFEILVIEDIQEMGILHFITCKEVR
jgi:head-tail adaptor